MQCLATRQIQTVGHDLPCARPHACGEDHMVAPAGSRQHKTPSRAEKSVNPVRMGPKRRGDLPGLRLMQQMDGRSVGCLDQNRPGRAEVQQHRARGRVTCFGPCDHDTGRAPPVPKGCRHRVNRVAERPHRGTALRWRRQNKRKARFTNGHKRRDTIIRLRLTGEGKRDAKGRSRTGLGRSLAKGKGGGR